MFEPVQIAPSILSADFMNMGSDIRMIEQGGAGYVHVDVMDGHFVPNLTLGVPFVKQLKKIARIPLDVHLMISNPLEQLPWFIDAGADILTLHLEALDEGAGEVEQALATIRGAGAKAALSIKPDTPVSSLAPYIEGVDMVLVMSVYPGFSGQSYIEGSDERVAEVAALAEKAGSRPLIEVDGGMGAATAGLVAACGADVLVAGNAVFGAPDPAAAIAEIARIATKAQDEALNRAGGETEASRG
ncbi:ribulose-phosphate 3-epimerase [Raoultibacter phocaeensis]|uniref:ribulose-phosphate 3-epimerase n=1 Tax=Raoultibacter phocaeensis TaxID=2479841 RepID=UPI00111B5583|nr:ribulose-phosphate 3-epimerase [Raoultibacter phocaeensis]